tara:strand:- start:243 stop:470 length:228 start_codon:yes stop_codon:yes gene_type:complete
MTKLDILETQRSVLVGQRAKLTLDMEIYLNNPTSIPEHTDFSEYLDNILAQLVEVNDKISLLNFLIKEAQNGNVD